MKRVFNKMTKFLNMFENDIGFSTKGITRKIVSMVSLSSKQHSAKGSAARKKILPRTTPCNHGKFLLLLINYQNKKNYIYDTL